VRGVLRDAHHAREHAQANELADELTCISIEYQGWAAQGGRQRGPGHSSAAGVRQCRAACARLVDAGSDVSSVVPGPIEPPFVTPRPGWAGRAKTAIAPPVMGINRQPSDFECVRFAGSGIIVVVVKGPARPPVREGDTLVDRAASAVIGQQRIDTEICIRCNTCEGTCPVGAVTHDAPSYLLDAARCNDCVACIPPCPTVSIDDWRMMPRARAYGVAQQLGLDERTAELSPEERGAEGAAAPAAVGAEGAFDSAQHNATLPPCSAARAYPHLYGPKAAEKCLVASVVGDFHVTEVGTEHHTHDLMLDFRSMPFPVLEGQSIGILPPGWM
jgi:ferredoxin